MCAAAWLLYLYGQCQLMRLVVCEGALAVELRVGHFIAQQLIELTYRLLRPSQPVALLSQRQANQRHLSATTSTTITFTTTITASSRPITKPG